jgi:hypothetical protein
VETLNAAMKDEVDADADARSLCFTDESRWVFDKCF